jgi:radical SAM superfamily enzyme YgiQ (UPF0313 family)
VKVLLVGINAKYVQMNLAIRLLKAFAETHSPLVRSGRIVIDLSEWNINQQPDQMLRGLFASQPDLLLFSTYIWNRDIVLRVAENARKVLTGTIIGFGGPEVSWSAEKFFEDCPAADLIIAGEGE